MNKREKSLKWWNGLNDKTKMDLTNGFFDNRSPKTLTGREIEKVFKSKFNVTENYSRNDILRISENMKTFGGSFMKCIGEALLKADLENTKKILETWPDEVEKYS